jgi:hypothetical protein
MGVGGLSGIWLLEERTQIDEDEAESLDNQLRRGGDLVKKLAAPPLAITLQDIVIHDTKKWFGGADIRLDALVVNGHGTIDDPESFYSPQTFRFPGVRDGEQLPTGESGLLAFLGKPSYFLDLFITASRDRKDSDDLSKALHEELSDSQLQEAFGTLVGLVAAPQVAAVNAALGAASRLGEFAYQLLRQLTGSTIGLLHTSWLEHKTGFGIGRHPSSGSYRLRDLSFWYEISKEQEEPKNV